MQRTKGLILRTPFEKSIKNLASQDTFRYSKNVKSLQERKIEGSLFPLHSKTCEKICFVFPPNRKYMSFKQDAVLELHGRILVDCENLSSLSLTTNEIVRFHLVEHLMGIYLNNGINKFLKGIKCSFNDSNFVNCSTLSFSDFNTFELFSDIENSLLKSTDTLKASNRSNDIPSQFELATISDKDYGYIGESNDSADDLTTPRIWKTTLPIYPFRSNPSFFQNRLNAASASSVNTPTVCNHKNNPLGLTPPPL